MIFNNKPRMSYSFKSFPHQQESDTFLKDHKILSDVLPTSIHEHYFKSDPLLKENHCIIQAPDITNCSVIVVTGDDYPFVHIYHAPPSSFPNEIDRPRLRGNVQEFIDEIRAIVTIFNENEKFEVNEIGFMIIGEIVSKSRIDYMKDKLQMIYDLSLDKVKMNTFEYSDIMKPNPYLETVITETGCSFKCDMITITYSMNLDMYQVSGPSIYDKKQIHFINHRGIWTESKKILPKIKDYVGNYC